ncbi:phage portal protein [Actinotalea sp. JY-7876]|uniref:phage portal protein n=1 Tax=Actinotalea sp. JY-7876 TaxID=2758442 RepID=UPI0015F3B265|nr:phage portal protein [Actinotalea sp. JY-7876]
MSLLRRSVSLGDVSPGDRPLRRSGGPAVTSTSALRQSVVWASCRLRADLISMMPIDVYRRSKAAGINVPVSTPPVLVNPTEVADGHPMAIAEWMYSGQMSLDRGGNNIGVIRKVDAFGLPAQIDLVSLDDVTMRVKGGRITEYRINGEKHETRHIWHERQHTVAGVPIGLSPVAYAALHLAGAQAAAEFAVDWFVNGAVPSAILKNEEKVLDPLNAERTKRRFLASTRAGEPFVTGKDWSYNAISAKAAEAAFIEQMQYSDVALARFYGVPGDLVDVAVNSSTINYANITQRNLQLLIMNLGAPVKRREDALERLTPSSQFVKLNRDVILAMDAKSRAELFKAQIDSRTRTPDQVRAIDDLLPLSDADYAQFERLWPARTPNQPQTSGGN